MTIKYQPVSVIALCLALLSACKQPARQPAAQKDKPVFTMYSGNVKDSFYISVQLPLAYKGHPEKKYPVVLLTDANFYYPMLAPLLHQYEIGGLLPPMILVGIGYRSFPLMDSLRVRDDLYPRAIKSDEMQAPGGGLQFYHFITQELLPKVRSDYPAAARPATLLGHSFGGYFSLYALLQQTNEKRADISGFVSASPSLWYNNFFLNQLPQKLKNYKTKNTLNIFLSVGGAEEPQWAVKPLKDFSKQLNNAQLNKVKLNNEVYDHLDHMDVGLISFTRALEKIYNTK